MSIAKLSNGTLLKQGDGSGITSIGVSNTENFTTVPEVMRLSGPAVRFDLLDVSSHDTPALFREYIPGFSDGDRIRAEINWRPSNTIHIALRTDSYNAALRSFKIVFPDSSHNTVLAATFIERLEPNADVGKVMTSPVDLKVTGAPYWN